MACPFPTPLTMCPSNLADLCVPLAHRGHQRGQAKGVGRVSQETEASLGPSKLRYGSLITMHRSRNSEVIQRSRTTHSPVLRPKKDPYSSSIISESSSGEDKEEAPGKTDLEGQVEQAPKLSSPEANTSSDDTHWKESNRTTLVTDSTCPSQLR